MGIVLINVACSAPTAEPEELLRKQYTKMLVQNATVQNYHILLEKSICNYYMQLESSGEVYDSFFFFFLRYMILELPGRARFQPSLKLSRSWVGIRS